jgi:hypothetical protein
MNVKQTSRRVGDTLHVFLGTDGDNFDEKIAGLEQPDGHAVEAADGSAVWIADAEVVDTTKSGSDQYTWDKSGNRIKHARTRFVRDASGNVTQTVLRFIYKAMGA